MSKICYVANDWNYLSVGSGFRILYFLAEGQKRRHLYIDLLCYRNYIELKGKNYKALLVHKSGKRAAIAKYNLCSIIRVADLTRFSYIYTLKHV